ncbi:MAG: RES family NAD+ phosphorylase [Chloroflexota bacterium]
MIGYRHADRRFPFAWETAEQSAGRWHAVGDGPVHYLAETPDGAWAELLRHEEIRDPADIAGLVRALWVVETPDLPLAAPALPDATCTGGAGSWPACQAEAARQRATGAAGLVAPSAALQPGTPSGFRVAEGLRPGPVRPERVFVLFGPRPELVAWCACAEGRPRTDLLARVRPLG